MEIYLDNSATTRVSTGAAALAAEVMTQRFGNPSSLHSMGFAAEQLVTAARGQLAAVLGCDREEILFAATGSEANNLAVLGAARARRRSGNGIVTTATEHSSLLGAVDALAADGFCTTKLAVRPDGTVDPAAVAAAVDDQTLLVSVMLVNSETGSINDIAAIAAAVHRKNPQTLLHCDAVQAFCRLPVMPRRWGVDLVTVSGHKIHAPKGVAALYRRRGVRLLPLCHGASQEQGLRPGTENVPGIAAMGLAAAQMWQDRKGNEDKLRALHDHLVKKVLENPMLCINSPADGALHIVNISAPGVRSEVMIHFLEQSHIYLSSGSACAKGKKSHVLTAMGLAPQRIDSALRISLSPYENSLSDIDTMLEKLLQGCTTLARSERK